MSQYEIYRFYFSNKSGGFSHVDVLKCMKLGSMLLNSFDCGNKNNNNYYMTYRPKDKLIILFIYCFSNN